MNKVLKVEIRVPSRPTIAKPIVISRLLLIIKIELCHKEVKV